MNPLVGFRAWRFHATHDLHSTMFWRHMWAVGSSTTARCLRCATPGFGLASGDRAHRPPGRECSCGLYARTTPWGVLDEYPLYPRSHTGLVTSGDMCMGAVIMTGEVAWGDKVIRAGESRPLCLCEPEGDIDPQRRRRLEAIAQHNQIPLIPWAYLVDYAAEFGDLAVDTRSLDFGRAA